MAQIIKKIRVAFYVRVSTEEQDYQLQLDQLNYTLATRNDVELAHIFAEKISGFKSEEERPEMANLLNQVENGLIDEVWVNEITRLSRAAKNLMNIVYRCADFKVNIFFKNQSLNSLDYNKELNPFVVMLLSILAQFAEMDAKAFKQKAKEGKLTKTLQGNYIGGTLPLGYSYIKDETAKTKKIVIDEDEAKVIKYIFDCYVNKGLTLRRIVLNLNNLKLTDKNFEPKMNKRYKDANNSKNKYQTWHQSTLSKLMQREWYAGYRVYKGQKLTLDDSLRIIPLDWFNKAQELLTTNKNKFVGRKYSYLLNDLIVCSCGDVMRPTWTGTNKFVYMCNKNKIHYQDKNIKCDEGKTIRIDRIENVVWDLIKNKIPDFKLKVEQQEGKTDQIKAKIAQNNDQIAVINTITIKELENKKKRAMKVFIDFGGDADELKIEINTIDNAIKAQNSIITEYESENTKLSFQLDKLDVASELEKNIVTIEKDKKLLKEYIELIAKKITIYAVNKLYYYVVAKIEFQDNINNNQPIYLFYNAKLTKEKSYHFIQSYDDSVTIEWDKEKQLFVYNNSLTTFEQDIDALLRNNDRLIGLRTFEERGEKQIKVDSFLFGNYENRVQFGFGIIEDVIEYKTIDKK